MRKLFVAMFMTAILAGVVGCGEKKPATPPTTPAPPADPATPPADPAKH
jgi:hypothetical protein